MGIAVFKLDMSQLHVINLRKYILMNASQYINEIYGLVFAISWNDLDINQKIYKERKAENGTRYASYLTLTLTENKL